MLNMSFQSVDSCLTGRAFVKKSCIGNPAVQSGNWWTISSLIIVNDNEAGSVVQG